MNTDGGATLHSYMDYELLTLREAANLIGKSIHNIAYLINYKRIKKYDSNGRIAGNTGNGTIYVSKTELLDYWSAWNEKLKKRRESLNILDDQLAFYHVSEKERTKHVHRLHPYLGKFIPQLVEYFVKQEFTSKDILLDPFMGSGTTMVVSSELGLGSVGVDISQFNCTIAKAKLLDYDLDKVENEISSIYNETLAYSEKLDSQTLKKFEPLASDYLNSWFAKRTLMELLFYRDAISRFENKDILKVILTRSARSSRLVHHYDIATPKKPVTEPYICRKHQDKLCTPIDRAIGKLRFYSFDTIRRLKEFSLIRKSNKHLILHGDSRYMDIRQELAERWSKRELLSGIFTSPPYVGQIDYHEQHRYAYELLEIPRNDEQEIGAKKFGKGKVAQANYQRGVSNVFINVIKALKSGAKVFIVANDKFNLYSEIISQSELKLIKVWERPVEARTEGDKTPYSEKIFECIT